MIADSSVLILFARARRLDLLHGAVGPVEIPSAVKEACIGAAPERPDARELVAAMEAGWLTTIKVSPSSVKRLLRRYPNLGRGEASALAAAIERREMVLLLDELPARRAALLEGLRAVGSLGIVSHANHLGLFKTKSEVAAVVRDLVGAGMWAGPDVMEAFWSGVGGRP